MAEPTQLIKAWLEAKARPGQGPLPRFSTEIGIRGYAHRVRRHYAGHEALLDRLCRNDEFGAIPDEFGLIVNFEAPVAAYVHDDDMVLDENLRALTDRYGPVSLINVEAPACPDGMEQRNIFQSLHFHIDRGADQPNQISMFIRNPNDPKHWAPRDSGSLFVANAVGHLQAVAEGESPTERRSALYKIFKKSDVQSLIGDIIYEHPWQGPNGTGEVAILNNRTLLHASYHRHEERGYPIAVRYLY